MRFVLRLLFRDERASFLNVKWQRFALHKNFSIQEKVSRIEQIVAQGKFRNKSHIIEYALNEYLKRDNHEG